MKNELSNNEKKVLKVADAIENECQQIEAGKKVDKKFFRKAISRIRDYRHQFKNPNTAVQCNVTMKTLYEKDQGNHYFACVEEALEDNNKTKLIETAWRYAQLVKEQVIAK